MSDDYLATLWTTGRVTIGGAAIGRIETTGDKDWFKVTLSAGASYQFHLDSVGMMPTGRIDGLSDPYLRLYSSNGSQLLGSDNNSGRGASKSGGGNSLISYTAPTTGTYYLGAADSSTGTGDYSLSAFLVDDYPASAITAGHLNMTINGDRIFGNIEASGDHDRFAVSLSAGTHYQFRQSSFPLTDPFLRLYSSTGNIIASGFNRGGNGSKNSPYYSLIDYTAPTSGIYYLDAADYSTGTGSYDVQAEYVDDYAASVATTGRVAIGGSSAGRIETGADSDWFAVSLVAGQTYRFHVEDQAGFHSTLFLANDDGGLGFNFGSKSGVTIGDTLYVNTASFTAATSGTYYLEVNGRRSGFDDFNNTSTYSVSAAIVNIDDYTASANTTGRVAIGSSATGRIETNGDHDRFAVTLTAGQSYQFHLDSTGLPDPYLRLYSSAGVLLADNDDGGSSGSKNANSTSSLNSLISYTAPASGTYYLDAADLSTGTGSYFMSAAVIADDYAANAATTGRVAIGGSATGRIETNGDHDRFLVALTAGQSYQFHLDSTGLPDPYLRLYSSAGTMLSSDNNSGGGSKSGLNSLVSYTAPTTGNYYLDAADSSTGTGNYSVSAAVIVDDYTASAATTGRVAIGGSATGRIETNGDHDRFAVTLTAGQSYQFRLNSTGLNDPYLQLYSSSGALLLSDDDSGGDRNSLISYTASISGTYYLDASAYNAAGIGTYSLSAATVNIDDYAANAATTGRVAIGGSATGRIEASGDHDRFAVSLTAGQSYQFHLDSTGLSDPYLRLYSSAGTMLTSDNNSGGGSSGSKLGSGTNGLNSLISYTAPTTGTYYLDAADSSTGTGNYSVSASTVNIDDYAASAATTGGVAIGGSTTGRIETIGDNDRFAVTLTAGQSYQFRLNSTGLNDPYLQLYSSSGALLLSDDDGGGGSNSLIDYTALASGTYYLAARDHFNGTGSYAVSVAAEDSFHIATVDNSFDITFDPTSTIPPLYQSFFDAAAARWEEVIVGDISDVTDNRYMTGFIDDLEIRIQVIGIDGPGGTLGSARPVLLRDNGDTNLPMWGNITLDLWDMASMVQDDTLEDVIIHEMGHVLGIGGLWPLFEGLVEDDYPYEIPPNALLQPAIHYNYLGPDALAAYRTLANNQGLSVIPVESHGGRGTAQGHWDECIFGNELMTGYSPPANTPAPLSIITIGSLADLGYQVNYGAADDFRLPAVLC